MKKLLMGSLAMNLVLLSGLAYIRWMTPSLPPPTEPAVVFVFTNAPDAATESDLQKIRQKQSAPLRGGSKN